MSSLSGKVSVVTGSTSGIGRGIAEHFARLGSNIVVHGRDRIEGLETVRRVKAAGREGEYFDGDLTNEEVCRALIRFAVARFGGLDILVNNAADTGRGDLEQIAVARWDTIMAVNLRAPFILLQESIAPMRARGGGSVINIGSVLAYVGEPKLGAYSVSKGGLMTLTKNAAVASQPRPDSRQPDQRRVDAHRRRATRETRRGRQGRRVDRGRRSRRGRSAGCSSRSISRVRRSTSRRARASASQGASSTSSSTRRARCRTREPLRRT